MLMHYNIITLDHDGDHDCFVLMNSVDIPFLFTMYTIPPQPDNMSLSQADVRI